MSASRNENEPPQGLFDRLASHGQERLLRWWGKLDETGRAELVRQIEAVDLARLDLLIDRLVHGQADHVAIETTHIHPVEVHRLPQTDAERAARRRVVEMGESELGAGEVAVVIVAGGQGTRLGFDGPKGTYAIGPVSGASLFQIHAEKVVALSRRVGKTIPLYIMTSPANHAATVAFFAEHDNFGLEHARFFTQGQMPAVDQATGKILLAAKGQLALSPDGHGGTLAALAAPGPNGQPSCLAEMRERGVRTIFYFQVDNPLVRVCDPAYLGLHRQADAEIGFKVVEKVLPDERVGVVVEADGHPHVIEYSDLPTELAERREPDGRLQLWAGSIAIHLFEISFIERLLDGSGKLPFHRALKKVPYVDSDGVMVAPKQPNAIKFEQFIFDALPLADRFVLMETDRAVEFEPLKNATGAESPATVRRRMTELFARWLERAGATVRRASDGSVPFDIEISPLFALDAHELRTKLQPGFVVDGPVYLR